MLRARGGLLLALAQPGCFLTEQDLADARDRDGDGYVALEAGGDDCDDGDPEIFPGAREICTDIVDSDCDGLTCPMMKTISFDDADSWLAGSEASARLEVMEQAGDFDGDGVPDIAMFERMASTIDGARRLYVVPLPGSYAPTGLDEVVTGTIELNFEVVHLNPIGDLDGDGRTELLASSRGEASTVWLLDDLTGLQSIIDSPDDPTPRLRVPSDVDPDSDDVLVNAGVSFGDAAPLGDLYGDGIPTFAFGSGGRSDPDMQSVGSIFVIQGAWTGDEPATTVSTTRIDGVQSQRAFGSDVTSLDLDSDGILDIVGSEPGYSPEGDGAFASRQVGANHGFSDLQRGAYTTDDADVSWLGTYDNTIMLKVQPLGDLNQDGHDDLGIHLGSGSGLVSIYYGPHSGNRYPEDADHKLIGDAGDIATQSFGTRIHGPGDLDGDGIPDLLLDAPTEGLYDRGDIPYQAGAHYFFAGPVEGVQSPEHAVYRFVGRQVQAGLLSSTVDLDGDANSDLILLNTSAGTDPYQSGVQHGLINVLEPPLVNL